MYYQLMIELSQPKGKEKTIYEFDKSNKDNIMNDFVVPYISKKNFFFDGTHINFDKVARFIIKTTEQSVEKTLDTIRRSTPGIAVLISKEGIFLEHEYTNDVTGELFKEAEAKGAEEVPAIVSKSALSLDKKKVFIVHGHDNTVKNEAARFVEKLGLESIILHEQVNAGKTVIEKIEEFSNVGFAIVLYTDCDLGTKK